MVKYFFTEKPMVFRRVDYLGKVHLTDGIGYILWGQENGEESKMIANTVRMTNQREANSWAKVQSDIYGCALPDRLRLKRVKGCPDSVEEVR